METNKYRFHLQRYKPGSKGTCPSCGHSRCLVRYVDDEGVITFPDNVGRCDREDSCGYHYTPKDYFHDNPEAWHDDISSFTGDSLPAPRVVSQRQAPEPVDISYIEEEVMKQSLRCYDSNPLFTFLLSRYSRDQILKAFERYYVGTSKLWNGATVFWQLDADGRIRGGKIMGYDAETGHRIKDNGSRVTWVHSILYPQGFTLRQCLFGEHLLHACPDLDVMIVESEKTAVISSIVAPHFLWLATGGKNGCFNREAMQVLKGRKVTLVPDLGATGEWTAKMEMLRDICSEVSVSHVLESIADDEQVRAGLDIADFFMMEKSKRQILHELKKRYPAVKRLDELFDLEIVED